MSSRILFDLLPTIFQFTLPPDYISLDVSIIKGPDSTWCKVQNTKISIILVSREWYQAGVALLYRDVVIRDFMQLLYFLRTLTTSETVNNPGRYVKSVFISCPVPQSVGARFDALVQGIYKYCAGITSLTLSGPIADIPDWVSPAALLQSLPPSITHLRIDQIPTYSMLTHILKIVGPSLISLRFLFEHYPDSIFEVDSEARKQMIRLPALRSLFVGTYQPAQLPEVLLSLIVQWNLPSLESLSISGTGFRLSADAVPPIISAHGAQLTYLHASIHKTDDTIAYLQLCPQLKKLVIEVAPWFHIEQRDLTESLFHNELKYIDICHSQSTFGSQGYRPKDVVMKSQKWTAPERFPCLQGVRHIWYLPTYMLPDIEHFDPTWVKTDEDRFEITIFDSKLRHEVGHLIWDGVLMREMVADLGRGDSQLSVEIAQADDWGSDTSSEWESSDEESASLTSYITEPASGTDEEGADANSERNSMDLSDTSSLNDYRYRSEPVPFDYMNEVNVLLQLLSH